MKMRQFSATCRTYQRTILSNQASNPACKLHCCSSHLLYSSNHKA